MEHDQFPPETTLEALPPSKSQSRITKMRWVALILGAVVVILALVLGGIWWFAWRTPSLTSVAEDCENPIDITTATELLDTKSVLDNIADSISEEYPQAEPDSQEVLNVMIDAGNRPRLSVSDDGSSLKVSGFAVEFTDELLRNDAIAALQDADRAIRDLQVSAVIACINDELGLPDSVQDRMNGTSALDGTQEVERHGITVSWSYHPDPGLSVIYEK